MAVSEALKHKTTHYGEPMVAKFYENDFEPTSIKELEFVRSPFYELAQIKYLKQGEDATKLLTDLTTKLCMTDITSRFTMS